MIYVTGELKALIPFLSNHFPNLAVEYMIPVEKIFTPESCRGKRYLHQNHPVRDEISVEIIYT